MKTNPSSLLHSLRAAAFAAAVVASLSSLQAQSWDGGSTTSGSWGNATNWVGDVAPTFGTSADLTFNDLTRPDNDIGAARIVRSITYGANMDSAFLTNTRTFNGGAAAQLTFQAASGNASVTVDAGATGNLTIGWNGVGTAGGAIGLGSNLDIIHNGSGTLLFNRGMTGANGFTKTGTGTWSVIGFPVNNFTGAANFNGGRAIFGNTNTVGGDLNTASAINLGGGTLEIQTSTALNKTLTSNMTVSAASTLAYNNTTAVNQTLTVSTGTMALNADLTVQNISTTTTLNNTIIINRAMTGTGDLIVETYNNVNSGTANFGLGRVALGGANSGWSGDLVIRQGTAEAFGDSTLGQVNIGTGNLILGETANSFGAGLLTSSSNTGLRTLANDITVRSGGFRTIRGGSDNSYVFSGNVTLEGDLNIHNGLFFTDKTMTFSGNISGVGGLSITESGNPNFIRLSGNNTYLGATAVGTNATLNILGGSSIGNSSAVTLASGSALNFNTSNETVGSIASSGTNGTINLGANTLTTGGDNTSTSYGGAIAGVGGSLTKVGNGIMTLTAAQTYNGTTTVSAGTLLLASGASLASNVQVAAGATLNATASGLGIATGQRIGGDGTVTGDLTLTSGAQFVFSLTQTLDVTGTVTVDSATFGVASLVNADGSAINWGLVTNGTYTLIGSTTTVFSTSNIQNFGETNALTNIGGSGKSAYFENGSLQLVVIPEPSTWAMFALGLTALGVFRRRVRNEH